MLLTLDKNSGNFPKNPLKPIVSYINILPQLSLLNKNYIHIKMWYKEYSWKFNPFTIKPSPDIIGYDSEREKLVNYISSGDICFLVGKPGVGKTSLLKWLENSVKKHFVIYLNMEVMDKNFRIQKFLYEHTKFSRRLFGLEFPKNPVFLLDESAIIDEDFRHALKLHFDENHIKSIVFAQPGEEADIPEGFRNRVGNRIVKLEKLKEEIAFDLIKKRCGKFCPFTEGAITFIAEKSNYLPRKILENCESICINMKGKKEININDVQFVLRIKPEEKTKLENLSPMEENILKILKLTNKTSQELAELLNTTEGSVGKQLSKLMLKNLVKIISHKRPKLYGFYKSSEQENSGFLSLR